MAIELQGGGASLGYANSVLSTAQDYIAAIGSFNYSPPTISVTWNSIAPPVLPAVPTAPAMPTIEFNAPAPEPSSLVLAEPTFEFSEFTEAAPDILMPAAPVLTYGSLPIIPQVGDVSIPDAPAVVTPDAPVFMQLSTVSFSGVDLHLGWLERLENIPTLTLASPTPFSFAPAAEYESQLLASLKGILSRRLLGGTGLPEAAEAAIWDRARDRETRTALANEAEIMRQGEALGFQLPAGVMAAQLREAQQNYYDKVSELSRDVAIKQAELEQTNLQQTITMSMQLEGTLIENYWKAEQFAFEAAKTLADNAVAIYNTAVEGYKGLLAGYQTYASAYKTIIDAELTKVEVYKAELTAEQTKAQVNMTLVQQYKASIEASMSSVEVYKAQVSGAQTLIQLEQAKIAAAGEQVRGFVASVNAETAKVEAYKAGIQAEQAKSEIFKTKAQAFSAQVGAEAERSRAELGRYTALVQAKTAEWDGYKTRVQVEGERIRALGTQSSALLDGFKAQAGVVEAQASMQTKVWESRVKEYEASQSIALQSAKINTDAYMTTRQMALDASKVAAQASAQLASSALGQYHFGESNGFGRSVSYSYSNDTATTAPTLT